jgi:Domain of unknown function (DUF5060)/Protein of unknown function (DUF4038)
LGYGKEARVRDILSDAIARGIVARYVPAVTNSPVVEHMGFLPIRMVVEQGSAAPSDPAELERMWHELSVLEGSPPSRAETPLIKPALDYETEDVGRSSARISVVGLAEQWSVTELTIEGPSHGNPFVDVELSAEFTSEADRHISVGGFYDGEGAYRIRFQAPSAGTWTYVTTSTARSLDGLRGAFEVRSPGPENHGPVGVADRFHFAYRDGTRFLPFGTTAYAWTHQPTALQERTLATLASSPFRKLRMCVFPKSYLFNTNEPERYPFARDSKGDWDFTRFDPQFFRHLEMRIDQLAELGIQTDLILFHPYDRWGFSAMPKTADDRYVQYLVRRLGAHRSVWWAMANEYDLLPSKTTEDWERLAAVVRTNDHVGHLTSIHNCHGFYDHVGPWITHCSIQRIDAYRTSENTSGRNTPSLSSSTNAATKEILIRAGVISAAKNSCAVFGKAPYAAGTSDTARRTSMSARSCGGPRAVPWWETHRSASDSCLRSSKMHLTASLSRCPATGTSDGAALRITGLRTSALDGLDTVTSRRRRKADGSSTSLIHGI